MMSLYMTEPQLDYLWHRVHKRRLTFRNSFHWCSSKKMSSYCMYVCILVYKDIRHAILHKISYGPNLTFYCFIIIILLIKSAGITKFVIMFCIKKKTAFHHTCHSNLLLCADFKYTSVSTLFKYLKIFEVSSIIYINMKSYIPLYEVQFRVYHF